LLRSKTCKGMEDHNTTIDFLRAMTVEAFDSDLTKLRIKANEEASAVGATATTASDTESDIRTRVELMAEA